MMRMDELEKVQKEMEALLKVSALAMALMSYSRFAAARTPPGLRRLLALLPVIAALPFLPFSFSSVNLRGMSAFFLSWLCVFKLLLLSFNSGPLSPLLPFLTFLPVATLPVKIRPSTSPSKSPHLLPSAIKALLFSLLLSLYSFRERFPFPLLLALYCFYIYLSLDLALAAAAFLGGTLLGVDFDPQFDAPYMSTSLQDFWGRRWNLMVTAILRPSVYGPVRARWGQSAGVMAAFFVSGAMHELMFYYNTYAPPTGEVLGFFVLHGACMVAEGWVKRFGERWRINPVVSGMMTLGFVAGTGFLFFFPPLLRNGVDERALKEWAVVVGLLDSGRQAVFGWFGL